MPRPAGYKCSEETIAKMRSSQQARLATPEARAALGAAVRAGKAAAKAKREQRQP